MTSKVFPLSKEKLEQVIEKYPTPFHIYDEKGIIDNVRKLINAFSWAPGFKEYFAVKANPNPFIMKLLKREGIGADCSSLAELELAKRCGIVGENIMFTSNDTPAFEYKAARELNAIINIDDISHIEYLEQHVGLPELVSVRYNPGEARAGNEIIGNPGEAKYGFTREQLFEGYRILKEKGIRRFGLHAMVASNELEEQFFIETAKMLYELVVELSGQLGIQFEFINIGGGIGIPYKPEQKPVDIEVISAGVKEAYERIIVSAGLDPIKLYMECGRVITGPYGYLVSRVLHEKKIYKNYIGLDSSMADLMRPGLYGAYHHITVPGKENAPADHVYDVTGSLCENNDKFAIDRELPEVKPGDLVVIHDTGAHGRAMGFNYNGKLRCGELLLRENGEVVQIRRAETVEDYLATLDFEKLESFS